MKRFFSLFFILSIALSLVACGGGGPKVSKEMKGFMKEIEKTNSIIDAASKYDYEAESIPLDLYDLEEPTVEKVNKKDGNTCYLMKVKHGIVHSKVNVCWKDKKLVDITEE